LSPAHQTDPKFEALLDYLKRTRGFDFSGYKRMSLMRRVMKRMAALNITSFTDYIDHLEVDPAEFALLFNTVLINVTSFFRDEEAWKYLETDVLPKILARTDPADPIRVWSAGCASGQEAYSISMLLSRMLGGSEYHRRVKIYATDIDEDALMQARQASYSASDIANLPRDYVEEFFVLTNGRYVFRSDLRRTVIFGRHDLVQDAPISHLDLLICRNTLMYLNAETQARIVSRMHFALKETGFLFLGKAEMLLSHSNLFSQVDLRHRVFSKVSKVALRDRMLVLSNGRHLETASFVDEQSRLSRLAFDGLARAYLVVDAEGILVSANERARQLFGVVSTDIGKPFRDHDVSFSPIELRSLIDQTRNEGSSVRVRRVGRNGAADVDYFDVEVTPITADPSSGQTWLGTVIGFEELTDYYKLSDDLQSAQEELETTNEELHSTNEELETTNEELQSTNEELETTNEELQSSNEELETTNEELHSANEELETIHQELQSMMTNVNERHQFLQSVLSSMKSAVIALDDQLRVTVWNERAEDLWGLRIDEALGVKFTELDIGLLLQESDIRACDERQSHHMIVKALNRRGREIQCEVCISRSLPIEGQKGFVIVIDAK
jgi:two-component system CheB/CheR fusion protein